MNDHQEKMVPEQKKSVMCKNFRKIFIKNLHKLKQNTQKDEFAALEFVKAADKYYSQLFF